MQILIKIGLSIVLFLCILDMPYGFYQLVRFVSMIGFSLLAFDYKQKGKENEALILIILALLFQPFFKISLGKVLWNIIDIIVAIGLLLSIFSNNPKNNKK